MEVSDDDHDLPGRVVAVHRRPNLVLGRVRAPGEPIPRERVQLPQVPGLVRNGHPKPPPERRRVLLQVAKHLLRGYCEQAVFPRCRSLSHDVPPCVRDGEAASTSRPAPWPAPAPASESARPSPRRRAPTSAAPALPRLRARRAPWVAAHLLAGPG